MLCKRLCNPINCMTEITCLIKLDSDVWQIWQKGTKATGGIWKIIKSITMNRKTAQPAV